MITIELPRRAGFADWRDKARPLLSNKTPPENIVWRLEDAPDLFGASDAAAAPTTPINVPRAFIEIAEKAALHSDPERFALLYRVLWRLQQNRALMQDAADPDIARLAAMAKSVRRDEHKMHAFARFREIQTDDGLRYLAWFEPHHHILEATADFFVRRFAGMRWSIVTPDASAHWDGEALSFGPGGVRSDVPADDSRDEDWRAYYESMFNPTRLNVRAMRQHMAKHYWRNMPEARAIPELVRNASARTALMEEAMPTNARKRPGAAHAQMKPRTLRPLEADDRAPAASLPELHEALHGCRACPLWKDATQAVPGEGRARRPLLALVGEQPGDQEDLAGKPFVGPAGQVLDRALAAAGIERGEIFVTNAVKHFKHEPRGKRRLHKRPDPGEIDICRWWMAEELRLVAPRLVVALGATALYALTGDRGPLTPQRGKTLQTKEGDALRVTVHPSYLLRLPDEDAREREFKRFVADLKAAKATALRAVAA